MTDVLIRDRKGEDTEKHREKGMCESRARDRNYAATNQGGGPEGCSPPAPGESADLPTLPLILDFWPLELRVNELLLFQASKCVAMCNRSHGKLIYVANQGHLTPRDMSKALCLR